MPKKNGISIVLTNTWNPLKTKIVASLNSISLHLIRLIKCTEKKITCESNALVNLHT